ncbi:hypothetical protein C5167_046292, partial [Papaver somniferum]
HGELVVKKLSSGGSCHCSCNFKYFNLRYGKLTPIFMVHLVTFKEHRIIDFLLLDILQTLMKHSLFLYVDIFQKFCRLNDPTSLQPKHGSNEALNCFTDERWSIMGNDGVNDVTNLVNSSSEKITGTNNSFINGFLVVSNVVLRAKTSMPFLNVPAAVLLIVLREHGQIIALMLTHLLGSKMLLKLRVSV